MPRKACDQPAITLALICEILQNSLIDARCTIQYGYLVIETDSQLVRISLDYVPRGN